MWNIFKVNDKNTRTVPLTLNILHIFFWCFWLWAGKWLLWFFTVTQQTAWNNVLPTPLSTGLEEFLVIKKPYVLGWDFSSQTRVGAPYEGLTKTIFLGVATCFKLNRFRCNNWSLSYMHFWMRLKFAEILLKKLKLPNFLEFKLKKNYSK